MPDFYHPQKGKIAAALLLLWADYPGASADLVEAKVEDDGHWVTLDNGAHVFIKGGQITKGPEGFVGKKAGDVAGGSTKAGGKVKQTDTPAFKEWFGDSKVVDDKGEPLVVYHGTAAEFDTFSEDGPIFFGTKEKANDFAGDSGSIIPAYVSIKNPVDLPWVGTLGLYASDIRGYKENGYDGAKMRDGVWVAFSPTQIKSATGNRGTWSKKSPKITEATDA